MSLDLSRVPTDSLLSASLDQARLLRFEIYNGNIHGDADQSRLFNIAEELVLALAELKERIK